MTSLMMIHFEKYAFLHHVSFFPNYMHNIEADRYFKGPINMCRLKRIVIIVGVVISSFYCILLFIRV